MPKIRATCPTCGDVDLTAGQVRLLVCTADGRTTYAFRCPACGWMVTRPASDAAVEALLGAPVETVAWNVPAELAEFRGGPALSHDDLLAFHDGLDRPDWADELVPGRGGGSPVSASPS